MAIVDYNYYTNTYLGETIAQADFPRYDANAERLIDFATSHRYEAVLDYYTAQGFTTAASNLTSAYKSAICAQIEYYLANGLSVMTGQAGEGFTVGKVSVNSGNGSTFATRGAAMLSPAAQMYLEQTGLLGRSIAVPCEPFAPFPWEVL